MVLVSLADDAAFGAARRELLGWSEPFEADRRCLVVGVGVDIMLALRVMKERLEARSHRPRSPLDAGKVTWKGK
jgi:hypothetical protein